MGVNQRQQITMDDGEIRAHLVANRIATIGTIGPSGLPHLVAMWYGLVDGQIAIETKVRSQKIVNLRRNPGATVLVESGETYDRLQGVSIEGTALIIDDADDERYWLTAISIHERYIGPYTPDQRQHLDVMMHNRVVVIVQPQRTRSWDHRKLGLPPQPVAGTTARHA